jgi:long-subunit acyl-CoA synthetase (AMP-forming)
VNKFFTGWRPDVRLSRLMLRQVHKAFGGELRAMFTGGAFMEPSTLQFFYDLGVPVANGYGLTEAGTVLTLNDFKPFPRRHRGQTASRRVEIASAESRLGRNWRSGRDREDRDVSLS